MLYSAQTWTRTAIVACLLAGIAGLPARAADILIVTSDNGKFALEAADSVLVNGKDKFRIRASAALAPAQWDAKTLGNLGAAPIESFTILRRAGKGEWLARNAGGAEWQPILPDGMKPKAPVSAAQLWTDSQIAVRVDRKDKTGHSIRVDSVYAIVLGRDAAQAAVWLASDPAPHMIPDVTNAEALRAMAALIPETARAFSAEPAQAPLRDATQSLLQSRVEQWVEGDAEVTVLNEALLFAEASRQAFPTDPVQQKLRDQAAQAKARLDRRIAILRALHAGRQHDAYLVAYRPFEAFDKSFPDLSIARRHHLEGSAEAHVETAERLRQSGDYAGAVRHLRLAQIRNPHSTEATKTLEQVRLEVARITAQHIAEARHGIDPRSPAQVQVQRRLLMAEQLLADSKFAEADAAMKEAEAIDADEPRIRLLQARLAIARGDLGFALAVLDLYAGMAMTPQDFAEGEKLRSEVQYKIQRSRTAAKAELASLAKAQRFATALEKAADSLKYDNEEPAFLYQAGVNACVLRNCAGAAPFLRRYLELTDSTQGDRRERLNAVQLLGEAAIKSPALAGPGKPASWFSGAPIEASVFYDPVSLAFQPKVARIEASEHLNIQYDWGEGTLRAVRAKYEDKKTGKNIASIAMGAAITGGASWRTADRETNEFYFNYYEDVPQVLSVNHDNAVVKSQTRRIRMPSALMVAASSFGGVGALGALGSVGGMGMAGMSGMSGLGMAGQLGGSLGGSMGGLGALATAASTYGSQVQRYTGFAQSAASLAQGFASTGGFSIRGDPQGGASTGLVTLWNSPRVDTEIARKATGKRIAIGFSGNRYFHPFVWDGIHLFELDYDNQGRIAHAREANDPGAPRLDFEWSGKRLLSVTGRNAADAVVYRRTLNYAGDRLVSEQITGAAKQSRIEYKYDKQGRLLEAECDDDGTLDGRSRKVVFLADVAAKGAR